MSKKLTRKPQLPFSGKKIELKVCPKLSFSEELRCGSCKKSEDELKSALKICNRCKIAYYCSKECQVKDHKSHKTSCKALAENASHLDQALKNDKKVSGEEMFARLSLALSIAMSKLLIAESMENSRVFKQIQSDFTQLLKYSFVKEISMWVFSFKAILYLYQDDFHHARNILYTAVAYVKGSNDPASKIPEQNIGNHANAIISGIIEDGFQDMLNFMQKKMEEKDCPPEFVQCYKYSMQGFMSEFHGSNCGFGNILEDSKHVTNMPEVSKNAPIVFLIAVLAFQLKAKAGFGDRFLNQRLEMNQVIKTIAQRNSDMLEYLMNPEFPKNSDWYSLGLLIDPDVVRVEAFFEDHYYPDSVERILKPIQVFKAMQYKYMGPLFDSIPGAREYILQYLYPGAEIVPEKDNK